MSNKKLTAKGKLADKEWRMSHLYKIVDINKKKVTFKKNRAQRDFDKNKWYRNLILKSRRLGFTTDESIDMLDDALFEPNVEELQIAHKKEEAEKIFDKKIHYAWKNLNEDLKARFWKVETDRTNQLKFNHGKGDFSTISVSASGRSGTYNRVHISEFAKLCKEFPKRASEVITGTIPAVTADGRVDIESTAEGEEGDFYDMFMEAWERGDPKYPIEYKAHFYNWTWDDKELEKITDEQIGEFLSSEDYKKHFTELNGSFKDYQEEHKLSDKEITYWYLKWLSLNKKFKKLFQEYPTTPEEAFVSSGTKYFEKEAVKIMRKYEFEGEKKGDWIIYKKYKPNHYYALGADVGHGKGLDSSTCVIMDFTPVIPEVVAEYANNEIEPDVFAHEVAKGGGWYGDCLAAVEDNDRGYTTLVELDKGIQYSNVFTRKVENRTEEKETKQLGWNTNSATKPKMMSELKTAYNDELIKVPSKYINREARTYDENDITQVKFDEEQTNHWDRLTGLAVAWQMKSHVTPSSSSGLGGKKRNLG